MKEAPKIKQFGHFLKGKMPLGMFKVVLLAYHKFRDLLSVPKSWYAMQKVEGRIRKIRAGEGKIRFGFYVVLESMFQFRHVFELMLMDDRFDPFVVVTPRIGWQDGDMEETHEKTYNSLVRDYGADKVFKGYENGVYRNYIERCDACSMMNAYHGLANPKFETEYFAMHGVPIFISAYGYNAGTLQAGEYFGMSSLKYVRRFYCSNTMEQGFYNAGQHLKAGNDICIVTGNPKSDAINSDGFMRTRSKKTILIAPHHSVIPSVDSGICIGNFLKYKNFFLELPKRYPEVHWIFRPHPHLRLRLTKDGTWKMADWDEYVDKFSQFPNAEYESSGAYYDSFARSDAIIQDCASFLPEYFYTGNPPCYMLASEEAKAAQFDWWGQELIAHTYQAFSDEDITRFIEDVVIGGNDSMREMRHRFSRETMMVNYPHASEAILEDIAETLGRGKGKSV